MKSAFMAVSIIAITALTTVAKAEEVSLEKDLMPLFQRSCAGCHQADDGNPDAIKTGFLFKEKKNVLDTVGKIIIKEKPEQSYLLMVVTPSEKNKKMMPPPRSRAPALTAEEIQKITDWIKAGAKDN